jgi:hypothetical protein
MLAHRSLWFVVPLAALVLAGCPKKDDDEETAAKPVKAPDPVPTATATTAVTLEPAVTQPGIVLRVKQELDNREDGITGSPLAAAGARGTLQSPTGWTSAKSGDFTVVTSADSKAKIGAIGAGTEKLEAAATALGLTGCQWNSGEPVTVGKGKVPGSAADGGCKKGTINVATAYVHFAAENLLVVGAWDPDGDANSVFGSMRSVAKAAGGDATGIAACCTALRQNAKSAPPEQQGAYMLAAGACDALRSNPQARTMLGTVRGMLAGAAVPSSCR